MTRDLVFGVSRRDYVRISRQAFGATFLGTALQATDLLYASAELGFPDRFRDFGIIASVEDIIDRVCATGAVTLARRSGEVLALPVKRQKEGRSAQSSPEHRPVTDFSFIVVRYGATTRATRCA